MAGNGKTAKTPAGRKRKSVPWIQSPEPTPEERKAAEQALALRNQEYERALTTPGAPLPKRVCTALTSGMHGTIRPCSAPPIRGGNVCVKHGGSAPHVKAAAKMRLLAMVEPTLTRMAELRDQDTHLPTALGAATHILNRVLGKPTDGVKQQATHQPVINIGIALGGLPTDVSQRVNVMTLPGGRGQVASEEDQEGAITAELMNDPDDELS